MEKVTFTHNVPVQVALKYSDGKPVEGRFGDQMLYTLVDGRAMYLDLDVAAKINALELRSREAFAICKRWSGKKGDPMQWDVWRPDAASLPPAPPAVQPEASAGTPAPAAAAAKTEPPASVSNGNGSTPANGKTNGNGNGRAPERTYVPDFSHTPPTKIPMDEAVVEAVRIVRRAMEVTGEQWSDASKQGLCSTILIASERQGWLCCWKREVTQ